MVLAYAPIESWNRGESADAKLEGSNGTRELSSIRDKMRHPIIGLAGGVGAGKTAVAHILQSLGARVLDFDRLAHEELCQPKVVAALRQWWGSSIVLPDGTVDRKAIASIVFDDPAELQRLENLLYPRLGLRCEELLASAYSEPNVKAVVLDAPKLFEAGLDRLCDTVIFVEASQALRTRRVANDRGWDEHELKRRENQQKPLDTKKANADHVVVNQAGLDELRSQVERIFSSVLDSS